MYPNWSTGLRCRESSSNVTVIFALTCKARLQGLLAYKGYTGILAIMPCRDIHTFGMKAPIDVAFIAEDGMVLESMREVKPKRRVRCSHASFVLERYSCSQEWPEKGSRIFFDWMRTPVVQQERKESL